MKERNRFYEELVGGSIVGVWLVDDTLVIHLFDDRQICVRGGSEVEIFPGRIKLQRQKRRVQS